MVEGVNSLKGHKTLSIHLCMKEVTTRTTRRPHKTEHDVQSIASDEKSEACGYAVRCDAFIPKTLFQAT